MNNENEIRKINFYRDLDQLLQENVDCYIDDAGNSIPCPNDETTVYNWIMDTEEYHLLGTDFVKHVIHQFMTDYKFRHAVLMAYNLY